MYKVLASTENMPYEDWLDWRRTGIGGSDASVCCGINRWKSLIELWMEKTNQMHSDEAGEAAYWGTRLEALVRDEFTRRTGIEVKLANQLLQSEEHDFMLANLDGVCQHPNYGPCIFEAKTSSAFRGSEWKDSVIPDEYALQVMHYMAVTGYRGAFVAALIGGNEFKWKFIERDDELIEILIRLESRFWNHVKESVPPQLDGSDASAKFLSQRFPDSIPLSKIELPKEAAKLILQYDEASAQLEQFNEKKQEAENLLKQMIGENEAGSIGDRLITWKTVTQERLDSKTLKVEHP
ncbi:MAG: YqaJ viral recombinase family protein, partial [Clostridiales bacterium]|nr:YqaJ viral recombinase family protein [Clostridiales bacterium]